MSLFFQLRIRGIPIACESWLVSIMLQLYFMLCLFMHCSVTYVFICHVPLANESQSEAG